VNLLTRELEGADPGLDRSCFTKVLYDLAGTWGKTGTLECTSHAKTLAGSRHFEFNKMRRLSGAVCPALCRVFHNCGKSFGLTLQSYACTNRKDWSPAQKQRSTRRYGVRGHLAQDTPACKFQLRTVVKTPSGLPRVSGYDSFKVQQSLHIARNVGTQ
jgi:hypothetical protein